MPVPSGLAGCGGRQRATASPTGSTLETTWVDPVGDAQLRVGPGEPLIDRLELGHRARPVAVLATLAHVTDSHVLDASSPARVTFLDRLGPPFESTFRPQETLTTHVLAGALSAVRALAPNLVIQGGDLIDNDQNNELEHALTLLHGGVVHPGSGSRGYYGVQSPVNADPFYYRPDIDAPRYPGLLAAAVRPFRSAGVRAPVLPVLGDHDVLVAGELVPTPVTMGLAVGDHALWDLPQNVVPPPGVRLTTGSTSSPDGPPQPLLVNELLSEALRGPTVRVPPDPTRREMPFDEVIHRLRPASSGFVPLNYVTDVGSHLRLVILDLVRRAGGSGGLVVPGQQSWLQQQLASAGNRWVIVVSHQPLAAKLKGGDALLSVARFLAVSHRRPGRAHPPQRDRAPRPTSAGGYWLINTASLIDFPQQARALRVVATDGGGVAIQTWMLDHVGGRLGDDLPRARVLPRRAGRATKGIFRNPAVDRNVVLYRRATG